MRSYSILGGLAAAFVLLHSSPAEAATWGGFDTTRVNYPDGVLSGNAHTTLAGVITASGDTIGGLTPTITAGYLSGIDVFYTSLLTNNNIPLSAAEQTALQAWIAGGGKLIVTADIFNLPGYSSFTTFAGVTGFVDAGSNTPGTATGTHSLVNGVTSIGGTTNATFTYGAGATLLASVGAQPFAVVLDKDTGWAGGGCILVVGDHNAFTNGFIANVSNLKFAQNFVAWTHTCNQKTNGSPCGNGAQCTSGFCADGVCCDTACGGGATDDCQACSVAAGATTDGTCAPRANQSVCRPGAGACDAAEVCDGMATACPPDKVMTLGSVCRPATDLCDAAETCDGSTAACPADALAAAGVECRAAANTCDVAETCNGTVATCPADALKPDGTVCDDGNAMTVGDVCTTGVCQGDVPMTTASSSVASTGSGSSATTGSTTASGSGGATTSGGTTSGAGGGGGSGDGSSNGSGCSCRTADSASEDAAGWLAALGVGLVVSRRRRRANG